MNNIPKDLNAYETGFNRGFNLCIQTKNLTREISAVLRSVASQKFHHSYGLGLKDGYSEGFREKRKDLVKQKIVEMQERKAAEELAYKERQGKQGQQQKRNQARDAQFDAMQGNPEERDIER